MQIERVVVGAELHSGTNYPFNRPHGFGLEKIGDDFVRTRGLYRRSIHNIQVSAVKYFKSRDLEQVSVDSEIPHFRTNTE